MYNIFYKIYNCSFVISFLSIFVTSLLQKLKTSSMIAIVYNRYICALHILKNS